MKRLKVICPTYQRAGKIKTHKMFNVGDVTLAMVESQAEGYRKAYPDIPIMVLPENIKGNMSIVRSYIKNNCDAEYLVMVDDDLDGIGYHENNKQIKMSKDELLPFFMQGFRMAEELGTVLWGVNLQSDPKFYRNYSPISMLQPVLGPFCGIITTDPNIEYDERVSLNEDYDISLQVLYHYHKVLRFNKYYYLAGHLTVEGGCGTYRTMTKEKEQAEIMRQKWGDAIVKYDFTRSPNPRLNVPLKGI